VSAGDPCGYRAIERALCLLARSYDDHEVAFLCRRIVHPAGPEAAELLGRGLRFRAEAALDTALETMAGPDDGKWRLSGTLRAS
jgi:hypothetical protein